MLTNHFPQIINISVHVAILFAFLSVFFIFYISKLESRTINKEISKSFVSPLSELPNDQLLQNLFAHVDSTKVQQTLSQPDDYATLNNQWMFKTLYLTNAFLIIIIALSTYLIMRTSNGSIPLKQILVNNAITFVGIGLIEYLFFTHVASKYVPVKPSVIAKAFIDDTQAKLKS